MDKKISEIQHFIDENIDAAEQGTKEWLESRQTIIGGSEIATLASLNPFSSIEQLIAQKVNLVSFKGNTATRWGNLFENISELLFDKLFISNTQQINKENKIYSTGSIPHKTIPNHRYSPDGLCCIRFHHNNDMVYKIALLEFKSPFGTVPTNKVPKHYLPQIKAGLCTIDITEVSLFMNNMFRKCSLNQLDFSLNYDNIYHRDTDLKLKKIDAAIANSIILFSIPIDKLHLFNVKKSPEIDSDSESESDNIVVNEFIDDYNSDDNSDVESDITSVCSEYCMNISDKIRKVITKYHNSTLLKNSIFNRDSMIDFGSEQKLLFDDFLTLYKPEDGKESFIDIKCVKPQINKNILIDEKFTNFIIPDELNYIRKDPFVSSICKKYNFEKILDKYIDVCKKNNSIPIGYLPWKLLRSSTISVEKEDDFLENIKDNINSTIDIIKDISSSSSSADEIALNFGKHFPDSPIIKKYFDDKPKSSNYYDDFL